MQSLNKALVLALCGAFSACGKSSSSGSEPALPEGSYQIKGPVCLSTGQSPTYPDAAHRLNLFDFVDASRHTLTIGDFTSWREISNGSCTLTVEQPIRTNINGSFVQMHTRKSAFVPEGCTLKIEAKGQVFNVGALSSNVFAEREGEDPDLPYELSASAEHPKTFTMLSQNIDALNVLWSSYGCAETDRLKWTLTPAD